MAHIKVLRDDDGIPRLFLNGLDLTNEIYADGMRVSSTGPGEGDEVCINLKVALSRLDIGDHEDVDAALLVGSALVNMARPVEVRPLRGTCDRGTA